MTCLSSSPVQALISVYNVTDLTYPVFMGYLDAVNGFSYGVTSDPKSATIVSVYLDDLQPGYITLTVRMLMIPPKLFGMN